MDSRHISGRAPPVTNAPADSPQETPVSANDTIARALVRRDARVAEAREQRAMRPGRSGGKLLARGPAPGTGGRPKGAQNKVTRVLRDAVLLAAEQVGEDGKGKLGLLGYCKRVARNDPRTFCSALLARVLPLQITGEEGGPVEITYVSADEVRRRLAERGIPIDTVYLEHDDDAQ
jgi:hypothetical protein